MSPVSPQLSYAAAVAGVKAPEPDRDVVQQAPVMQQASVVQQTPVLQKDQQKASKENRTSKSAGRAGAKTQKKAKVPSVVDVLGNGFQANKPKRGRATQKSTSLKVKTASGHAKARSNVARPTEEEDGLLADALSEDEEDGRLTYCSRTTSRLNPLDPDDSMYHGKVGKGRVGTAVTTSIIRTRAALRAEEAPASVRTPSADASVESNVLDSASALPLPEERLSYKTPVRGSLKTNQVGSTRSVRAKHPSPPQRPKRVRYSRKQDFSQPEKEESTEDDRPLAKRPRTVSPECVMDESDVDYFNQNASDMEMDLCSDDDDEAGSGHDCAEAGPTEEAYDARDIFIDDEAIEDDDSGDDASDEEDEEGDVGEAVDSDEEMEETTQVAHLEDTRPDTPSPHRPRSAANTALSALSPLTAVSEDESDDGDRELTPPPPSQPRRPRSQSKGRKPRGRKPKSSSATITSKSVKEKQEGRRSSSATITSKSVKEKQEGSTLGQAISSANTKVATTQAPNSLAAVPRRTFGSVVASVPTGGKPFSSEDVFLEDLQHSRLKVGPLVCGVTDVNLQDTQLRSLYTDLPPLNNGSLRSWSEAEGPGHILFSKWAETCPDMSFDSCLSIIDFRSYKAFINPSRMSPLDVCVKEVPGPRPKYHLCTRDRKPAICLSTVFCTQSHVLAPPERGLRQKSISGIFHSQEWERFVGFVCTVFGHEVMDAQLARDAIQFTTRADFKKGEPRAQAPTTSRLTTMFSNVRSPSTMTKANSMTLNSVDTFSLATNATIPVYDCRAVEVDFNKDLHLLDTYPRWTEEIPYGSFTVVAYTVAVFRGASSSAPTISLNIQWAMLLGTPN